MLSTDTPRKLILVRHSQPEILPDVPARQWQLSDMGRRRCRVLADHLAPYEPGVIVASLESKAISTARIVAEILGTPLEIAPDLHEHDRRNVKFHADEEGFESQVISFFQHPDSLVFGSETADEAHSRFASAVDDVVAHHPTGNLVVVTHGTVMTLFVSRAAALDPVAFWRALGLPSFAVLALPGSELLDVAVSMEEGGSHRHRDRLRQP